MKYTLVVMRHYKNLGTFTDLESLREFLIWNDPANAEQYSQARMGYSKHFRSDALNHIVNMTEWCYIRPAD